MIHFGSFPGWRDHFKFNSSRNGTYLHSHRSDTIWKGITDDLVKNINDELMASSKKTPVLGLSFDTKQRDLAITIHFLHALGQEFDFVSTPFCRLKVAGENAKGLSTRIIQEFEDKGLELNRLCSKLSRRSRCHRCHGCRPVASGPVRR